MKKTVLLFSLAGLLCLSSCSAQDNTEISDVSAAESMVSQTITEETKDKIRTVSSSLTSPLKFEEWGAAAKFSTADQEYYNVPVRLLSLVSGAEAEKEVRAFMNENSEYVYSKPEKNEEWVLLEYELSLDGFPVDESGADASVVSFVTAEDGGYIESSGEKYSPATVCITDGKYCFEGTVKGKIALKLPKDCRDAVISVGEYNETQAYFSISDNGG